jgi:hypothetical protein
MMKFLKRFTACPEGCSSSDWVGINIFSATLFLPVLIMYVGFITDDSAGILNMVFYFVMLVVSGYYGLRHLNSSDVFIMLCIYSFFVLNFIMDPSLSEYYVSGIMIAIYITYVPISVCIVRKIKDWNYFFDGCRIFCLLALLVALGTVFSYDSDVLMRYDFISYMPYSYFMLPFILCSYVLARRKRSLFWLATFFALYASILSHGARNAVVMPILFVCAYELFTGSLVKRVVTLIVILGVGVVLFLFLDKIMYALSLLPFFENSRLVTKFLAKAVTSGGERDLFINEGIRRLLHMEMEVPGLFGDRAFISGPYPHNIFLEILLQFGWILGTLMCVGILYLIVYAICFSRNKVMGLYLFFGIFVKLIVSDSYVMYGNFWLWLFASISLCYGNRRLNFGYLRSKHKPKLAKTVSTGRDPDKYERISEK